MVVQREMSELVTPGEAAQMLYVHINTLRRWGNKGILTQYRIGSRGDRRFLRHDIINLLNQLQDNDGYLITEQ